MLNFDKGKFIIKKKIPLISKNHGVYRMLKSKNEIVAGVIYDTIKDEIFYGEKNNGAYLNNYRIRVSKRKNISQSLFASGDKNLDKYNNINIRRSGSAALDIAYVACGRYEGYFQKNLSIWDIAAGLIILKEAGGVVNQLDICLLYKSDDAEDS